ncbi:MAG: hypothetical protein ACOX46_08035 [Limnochordia bacterium]|nr:hypothetical protein [Bacillota bacterium]NLL08208.1 hypothetical protein [Bacillota bacterium]
MIRKRLSLALTAVLVYPKLKINEREVGFVIAVLGIGVQCTGVGLPRIPG